MIAEIDPLNVHMPKGASAKKIVGAVGILPMFYTEACVKGLDTAHEVYEDMVKTYGFGDYSGPSWGTVKDDGTYVSSFEEDPDMAPLMKCSWPDNPVVMYIYQHAILAVVDGFETPIITRMD